MALEQDLSGVDLLMANGLFTFQGNFLHCLVKVMLFPLQRTPNHVLAHDSIMEVSRGSHLQ